jgi:hypothetical protein
MSFATQQALVAYQRGDSTGEIMTVYLVLRMLTRAKHV